MKKHVPNDLMAEYYAQRASCGLIISEATMIAPDASAFWTEGGIFNKETQEGWAKVTKAVHDKGGKIACQLYHAGRSTMSCINKNSSSGVVSASAIPITNGTFLSAFHPEHKKDVPHETPRALTDAEIPDFRDLFANAAFMSMEAGFDAVEFHSANAYLLASFLGTSSNLRQEGPYSCKSIENRARLLFECVDKSIEKGVDAGRIGIRISPLNQKGQNDCDDASAVTEYIAKESEKRNLGFLHLIRGDMMGEKKGDILSVAKAHLNKTSLVSNLGYTVEEAEAQVASGKIDAVAFGKFCISNPDLVERISADASLNPFDVRTFYTHGTEGYTDYPFMKRE